MNMKLKFTAMVTGLACLSVLSGGCSKSQAPVQRKEFSPALVKSIIVDYDGESVTVYKSDSEQIVIAEYMDKNRKTYFAHMDLSGDVLSISEGARPIGNGVHSYIEIYLPETYQDSLSLHTTDGVISSDTALSLSSFHADTTNGEVKVSNLTADEIDLKSTGGKVTGKNLSAQICTIVTTNADTSLDAISGMLEYKSKGGDLAVTRGACYGSFQATGDGGLEMSFAKITGDIYADTKNGDIALTLPDFLNFSFSAESRNGSVQTSFSEFLSITDRTAAGTVGENAGVKIGLETKNGNISATR